MWLFAFLSHILSNTHRPISSFYTSPPSILSSLPTIQSDARLSVFYSPASVLNSQWSAAQQQMRLQAEIINLKDTLKTLITTNDALIAENRSLRNDLRALRADVQILAEQNAELEIENTRLIDELRVEQHQSSVSAKKAREDLLELERAVKERDAFVQAMVDINLHQPVLRNAYNNVEEGRAADDSLIQAIQSAAREPGSLWSKVLAPSDVTNSELYTYAIEMAATARIQTDETARAARFWKHVAKSDFRNIGVITPSPSTLEAMDERLQKEERGSLLDDLLEWLHAGEDIRLKAKAPIFVMPAASNTTSNSPALACSDLLHKDLQANAPCPRASLSPILSLASDSCPLNMYPTPTPSVIRQTSDLDTASYRDCYPFEASHSLEDICRIFIDSDSGCILNEQRPSPLESFADPDSSSHLAQSLLPSAVREHNAALPFSTYDLALRLISTGTNCRVATLVAPGDKEKKVQTTMGQKARFDGGAPLARSKALRKPRRVRSDTPASSVKATPKVPGTTGRPVSNKVDLPTPPSESDCMRLPERYVQPLTVTRKREFGSEPIPVVTHRCFTNDSVFGPPTPSPTSPSKQKIRCHAIKVPSSPCYKRNFTASRSFLCPSSSRSSVVTTASQECLVWSLKNKVKSPPKLSRVESNKENIPLPTQPPSSTSSSVNRFNPGPTPPLDCRRRSSIITSQQTLSAVKPITLILKPVTPLRISKKNLVKESTPSATPAELGFIANGEVQQ